MIRIKSNCLIRGENLAVHSGRESDHFRYELRACAGQNRFSDNSLGKSAGCLVFICHQQREPAQVGLAHEGKSGGWNCPYGPSGYPSTPHLSRAPTACVQTGVPPREILSSVESERPVPCERKPRRLHQGGYRQPLQFIEGRYSFGSIQYVRSAVEVVERHFTVVTTHSQQTHTSIYPALELTTNRERNKANRHIDNHVQRLTGEGVC